MITCFICCNNSEYLLKLTNSVISSNPGIKLTGFSNKLSEQCLNYCNETKPNIIIATNDFHVFLQNWLTFDYLKINISQTNDLTTKKICNTIKKFIQDSTYSHKLNISNFRKEIYNKLQNLGFNFSLCGTQYLLDYIIYLRTYPSSKPSYENILNAIAEKHNTNIQTIHWNIHTSIDEMCKYTSENFRKNVYGTPSNININSILKVFSETY